MGHAVLHIMSLADPTTNQTDWHQLRESILERDNYRCTNCTRPEEIVQSLQVDHIVPRSQGGSDRFSNLHTLCNRCHESKHGEGYAPSLEFQSTGAMDDYTFRYFRQFFDEILPAMGRAVGVRLDPKFRLDNRRDVWFVSLGDTRHADATLSTFDEEYNSLRAADYIL